MFVEEFIEEDDLAGDLVATESLKFFEGVDGDYVGGEAVGGCCRASAEGGEDNLLRGGGHHAGILDQGGGFGAANPVRDGDGLEADIEAEVAKFFGYVFGSGAGLGRPGGAGSDVLGEVSEFAVGVVVVQRGGFDGGKLLQKKRREIQLCQPAWFAALTSFGSRRAAFGAGFERRRRWRPVAEERAKFDAIG